MVLSLTSALSLFSLIALSAILFFVAKRFRLPYTVLLVSTGLLLVPIVNLPIFKPYFGFLGDFVLTTELLFYIFLPVLIFESGYNMNIRKMLDSAWIISALSVVSLLISAFLVAVILYVTMPLIGIEMPFIIALLFGAIISPTDPVAALSLFKESGVPRRLAMLFEGESLMNDGTAMALFLVVLAVAVGGYHGAVTIGYGVLDFVLMIALGIALGVGMAAILSKALDYTKSNDFVTVTLVFISAHLVFITSEVINHTHWVHVSSIIATTVAALFLGNYSRSVLRPDLDEYMGKLIEHMAFVVNSLVFLMAGLLFANSGVDFLELWLPILLTVVVVAVVRVISVYAAIWPVNALGLETPVPSSWSKLLAWASMRGALSIIIVLLIPADYTITGWALDYPPRDFLLALTIGCILATLFIKAPLIGPIIRRLKIDAPEPLDVAHKIDLTIYCLLAERNQLHIMADRGFVSIDHHASLVAKVDREIAEAQQKRDAMVKQYGDILFEQSLHLSMVQLEKNAARQLLNNNEISEAVYRIIYNRLTLQREKIEAALHHEIDPSAHTDRKNVFDRLMALIRRPFAAPVDTETPQEKMPYYRAQMIMARKAVKAIEHMQTEFYCPVFLEGPFSRVIENYRHYQRTNAEKLERMLNNNGDVLAPQLGHLADCALARSERKVLAHLRSLGLVDEHSQHSLEQHLQAGH
jgi:CPA1 family monovalent cation:H+ antiporter